jgi:DNA-binding Lrp family transcriptional regulator
MPAFDALDARLLLALTEQPRATTLALAETTGASRNTVQARLNRFDDREVLRSFEHRINPAALGYPLTAFITIIVRQQKLDAVGAALAQVPEVLEVYGLSGPVDLLARVVAKDADDLYRIAGQILATAGVDRTETALTMRRMVDYRVGPLLERVSKR